MNTISYCRKSSPYAPDRFNNQTLSSERIRAQTNCESGHQRSSNTGLLALR